MFFRRRRANWRLMVAIPKGHWQHRPGGWGRPPPTLALPRKEGGDQKGARRIPSCPLPPCGGGLGWGVGAPRAIATVSGPSPPTLALPRKDGGDKKGTSRRTGHSTTTPRCPSLT